MFQRSCLLSLLVFLLGFIHVHAQVLSDLRLDWSNTNNPNGAWTYREGTNALPAVASWQSALGGWSSPQPGWARSENGTDRIPFIFRSNGTETFIHDWLAGDIVIHSTDPVNGVGNGPGNVIWTSTTSGFIDISGGTWLGRDLSRGNTWSIWKNGTQLTDGIITSGDPFNRANPFQFLNGSGGPSAVTNVPVSFGDTIMFRLVNTTSVGEFAGVNMTISASAVPEPGTIALCSVTAIGTGVLCWKRHIRKRRK